MSCLWLRQSDNNETRNIDHLSSSQGSGVACLFGRAPEPKLAHQQLSQKRMMELEENLNDDRNNGNFRSFQSSRKNSNELKTAVLPSKRLRLDVDNNSVSHQPRALFIIKRVVKLIKFLYRCLKIFIYFC